jgi:hypothetical protein
MPKSSEGSSGRGQPGPPVDSMPAAAVPEGPAPSSPPRSERPAPPERETTTWLLQADAAAAAGCSVSAIRKWRRAGVVAHRTRVTQGGLRRVEVALEAVIHRMAESMPTARAQPPPAYSHGVGSGIPSIPAAEIELFLQHISEAEKRAAHAEARVQASEAMLQFLRDRVADLQRQLDLEQRAEGAGGGASRLDLQRLATEVRALRQRLRAHRQGTVKESSEHRLAIRSAHDAALICLCIALGIPTTAKLGDPLTSAERARLSQVLADAGYDVGR